jgi:hexosaminidase
MPKRAILFFLLACTYSAIYSQDLSIIPKPVSIVTGKGAFWLSSRTKIKLEGSGLGKVANFLNAYLQKYYGFSLAIVHGGSDNQAIVLNFERMDHAISGAYQMKVGARGVYIAGDNEEGVFYGVQTLIQLLPAQTAATLAIPEVRITDYPRFVYRGLHLDVGRHFFSVDFIKQYIDFIALHKMNEFHWHLTEDQGWRIEIKKYPLLTQVGSCRKGTVLGHNTSQYDSVPYCGYYTQQQVKEVVQYAADRYITVIPEIELPGHSSAALTAYPFLGCTGGPYQVQERWGVFKDIYCAGNDSVFQFLEDVLDEVMALFPSTYIHIGGDESPKDRWKACPKCQKRILDNHLKDEHELQSYFVQRIEKYLNSKGRKIIGWDEILEGGLAANATVMSWRGEQGGIDAANQHHRVIMTPGSYVYFDHAQLKNEDSLTIGGYLPLQTVYNYEPVPKELVGNAQSYIQGAQANLWTEYVTNEAKAEYMLFPRLSALSEVLWSPKNQRNWEDFSVRMQTQYKRYDLWKVNYCKGANQSTVGKLQPKDPRNGLVKIDPTNQFR